jgi:hypothetical protein
MPSTRSQWKVLPHQGIEKLEENLWRVQGTVPGMPLQRVMTLARLDDGRIVVHSAIALDESEMGAVEHWGCPSVLVVPNAYHRLDVQAYKARYPELTVLCPRAAFRRVAELVPVDGDFAQFPRQGTVRCGYLEGTGQSEGFLSIRHEAATTLVLNDLVFNMPHLPGLPGLMLRYGTKSTGGPTISRVARWLVVKNRSQLQKHLRRLASTPDLSRIIVSHHEVIDQDAAGVLRRLADGL